MNTLSFVGMGGFAYPSLPKELTMLTFDTLIGGLQNVHTFDRYASAKCPFHQDGSPSLLVFKDGYFKCLGCNRHGNWKMLWNKVHGQAVTIHPETRTIFQAPRQLEEYQTLEHLCYQAHMDLLKFTSWQWYLEMRGLGDSVEIAEIGYHRGWYTVPVKDRDGNFKTAVFRSAPHVQEVTGTRYWCNHAPEMFVPDWRLLDNAKYVVVVYGIFDALTLNKLRQPVVTGTAGKGSFCPEWLDNFRKPIYIIPDKGEEETACKLAAKLGWRGNVVRLDFPKGCKDTNDFLVMGKERDLEAQLTRIDR
jgi:hypothetical protein